MLGVNHGRHMAVQQTAGYQPAFLFTKTLQV